jgi:hypothetical protein
MPENLTSSNLQNIDLDISLYTPKTPGNHRQDNRAQSNLAASKSFNPTIVKGTASASSAAIEDKD